MVLKTSQMTKNLLLNTNQYGLKNETSAQGKLPESSKASTLKIAVNSILNSQGNQIIVSTPGELSARVV